MPENIIHSTEKKNLSRKADNSPANQNITRILWKLKFYYPAHKIPYPFYNFLLISLTAIFYVILHITDRCISGKASGFFAWGCLV